MKQGRAQLYYNPVILCPLCNHLEGFDIDLDGSDFNDVRQRMIDHLVKNHSDKEAIDMLGWNEVIE